MTLPVVRTPLHVVPDWRAVVLLLVMYLGAVAAAPVLAQQGTVHEGLTVDSAIMGTAVRYVVYLPADYDTSSRSYPIVYLLHGYGGSEATWLQNLEMNRLLDDATASGELSPMIVVMPDGGRTWYIDSADGSVPWESMFLQELMPQVEGAYRVRPGKQYRGIAGLSMGGFGALTLSMRHPDLFAAAAALSAAIVKEDGLVANEQDRYDRLFALPFGQAGLSGAARLTDHYRSRVPIQFVQTADPEPLRTVRYWIDCGDDDFLSSDNGDFHDLLLAKEIPHEYRVRDGGHTREYWHTGLVPALTFIARSFRGER